MMPKEAPDYFVGKIRELEKETRVMEIAFDAFKQAHPKQFKALDAYLSDALRSSDLEGKMTAKYSSIQEILCFLKSDALNSIEAEEHFEQMKQMIDSAWK